MLKVYKSLYIKYSLCITCDIQAYKSRDVHIYDVQGSSRVKNKSSITNKSNTELTLALHTIHKQQIPLTLSSTYCMQNRVEIFNATVRKELPKWTQERYIVFFKSRLNIFKGSFKNLKLFKLIAN